MKAADPIWSRPKTGFTTDGRRRATIQSRPKRSKKAPRNPRRGEKTIPCSTLPTPSTLIASAPAAAVPAPTIEKTSAWLELEGMPYHQVTRFQAMAESSAAATKVWVANSGAMIPSPTVLATAVPLRAPITLNTAAMRTARPGESTRVATEVAIALAVSWKPLMKSNPSPSSTIATRESNSLLGILDQDAFQRVGDALGAVGGVFQQAIDFAP